VDASFVPVVVSRVCGGDALRTADTKVWQKKNFGKNCKVTIQCDNITVTKGGTG
jgi:hypothetical protein